MAAQVVLRLEDWLVGWFWFYIAQKYQSFCAENKVLCATTIVKMTKLIT